MTNTEKTESKSESTILDIRMVEVDGQLLRVGIQRGTGQLPPLLIFNGVGANLELVEPFAAALQGVEIIIFDVPGVGGSPVPALPYRFSQLARLADRLLHKLGYTGEVDVLGVSWGGALAQEFAHLFPGRCRRLVLAATSPGALMVPGKPSVLMKLFSPRRYRDPGFLDAVGGNLYGGGYRNDPGTPATSGRRRDGGYLYQLLAAWAGAARGGWAACPSRRRDARQIISSFR
jgi:poly(3-hydroxyalkanoate) depolymerase